MTPFPPHPADDPSQYLDAIYQELRRLNARLDLQPSNQISPFIPVVEAAKRLHYANPDRLKDEIRRGEIPTHFVRWKTGPKGERRRYFLDIEGYIAYLRGKGRR